jgi:hypothetical protein
MFRRGAGREYVREPSESRDGWRRKRPLDGIDAAEAPVTVIDGKNLW